MRIGQLLDGFVHDLDNLAISRYDRFSILSYPKHTLRYHQLRVVKLLSMLHAQSSELWGQILSVLGSFESHLSKSLIDDPKPDWEKYLLYVRGLYQQTMEQAADVSINNVQSVSASIAGLSRYSDEFYWKSDVDEARSNYLNELAHLSVKLLNAYNL